MYEDAQTFFQKTLALGPNLIEASLRARQGTLVRGRPGAARWTRGARDTRPTSSIHGASGARRCWRRLRLEASRPGRPDPATAAGVPAGPGARAARAVPSPRWQCRDRRWPGRRRTVGGTLSSARPTSRPANDTVPVRSRRRSLLRLRPDERMSDWRGHCSIWPFGTTRSPGSRDPARTFSLSSRPTRRISGLVGPGGTGVGCSRRDFPHVTAHHRTGQGPRHRRRAIPFRPCATNSRISRSTNTSTTCRRAGSMRAMRATPREVPAATTLATNVALALRGAPTLASLDTGLVGTEGEASVSYALAYRAVRSRGPRPGSRVVAPASVLAGDWLARPCSPPGIRRTTGHVRSRVAVPHETPVRGAGARSDLAFATVVFLGLLTPLYLARRRRDRVRLEVLRDAEAAADRVRLEAALSGNAPPRDGGSDGLRQGRSEAAS